jgi:fatty acid kinase
MDATLDAPALRRAMSAYADSLARHREELNSLNVYPVPDGDTGTNMLLTQRAVVTALAEPIAADGDLSSLRDAISRASLLGARGNSGVILSQVLRGMCERFIGSEVGPRALAEALSHAALEAWRAVARPVEGTVLTVMREAAEAAMAAAETAGDCRAVMAAALDAARTSLARTRESVPELRQAGVVDAGGKGIVLLFDAFHGALGGEPAGEPIGPLGPVGRAEEDGAPQVAKGLDFEVQFLLRAAEDDQGVAALRRDLMALGESIVIVGGGGLFNVHAHTNQPGRVVEAGIRAGRPRDISITYLPGRVERCIAGQARAVQVAQQRCAVVAVVEGTGLAAAFSSLGAMVVPGGAGNIPSPADLLAAVEAAPAPAVALLPNHPNVIQAAARAADESSKEVRVIASRSLPAGLAAATAFHPGASLEENMDSMEEAAQGSRSGELARAERDATTAVGPVHAGQWMSVVDGDVVEAGDGPVAVAVGLVRRLGGDGGEILTLVVGEEAGPHATAVELGLREAFPGLHVEVLRGDQPRYPFLIGVE